MNEAWTIGNGDKRIFPWRTRKVNTIRTLLEVIYFLWSIKRTSNHRSEPYMTAPNEKRRLSGECRCVAEEIGAEVAFIGSRISAV
jgi:hypothetical protein